jgi:ParB/RepB/Spo0J family partition protein
LQLSFCRINTFAKPWHSLFIMSDDKISDDVLSGMLAELLAREGLTSVTPIEVRLAPDLTAIPPNSFLRKGFFVPNSGAVPRNPSDSPQMPYSTGDLARELGLSWPMPADDDDPSRSLPPPVTRDPRRLLVESRQRVHRGSRFGRILGREPADVQYEVRQVYLSQITTGSIRNSRQDDTEEEFAVLLASIERRGVLQPVLVTEDPQHKGSFVLVGGFRRFRAACELGLPTVLVTVCPIHSIAEAYMINLAENFARKAIGPYALACQCRHLQEMLVPIHQIAEEIGRDRSYLYALMRFLDLPEAIVADWKAGHPLLTVPRLQKLKAMPPKDAVTHWLKLRARHLREESAGSEDPLKLLLDEDVDSDEANALAELKPYRRPTRAALQRYRVAIAQMEMPQDPEVCRQICLDTIDLACGVIKHVRHVPYRPRPRKG